MASFLPLKVKTALGEVFRRKGARAILDFQVPTPTTRDYDFQIASVLKTRLFVRWQRVNVFWTCLQVWLGSWEETDGTCNILTVN